MDVGRIEAEQRLKRPGLENGTFIIRPSTKGLYYTFDTFTRLTNLLPSKIAGPISSYNHLSKYLATNLHIRR